MKEIKLYNVIFPIWLLIFFPPVIFIALAGNFLIDSLVLIASFYVYKLATNSNLKTFYKKNIVKVWLFGFLADAIGAIILFLIVILGDYFELPYEFFNAISYDPFSNYAAVMVILFAMLVSALFIYLFNYKIVFKKVIEDTSARFKVAFTIALVTMPWTFLLPTKWFYYY
ncbi:MAG: hypothetical protein GX080_05205 [Tissierellia bacterium]|nr:hypothetical protein [Tissierellia bacterium]